MASCPQFAFAVQARLAAKADPAKTFVDFAGFLSGDGLMAQGAHGAEWLLLVTRDGSQAVDSDREKVQGWLASNADVESFDVGVLVDLTED